MPTIARFGLSMAFTLLLAGCVTDTPAGDQCRLPTPGERALAGVFVGRPAAVPAFAILPVEGRTKRDGSVGQIEFEGFTFDARPDEATGGLRSGRGNSALPMTALDGKAEGVNALDVTYTHEDGTAWTGRVVTGAPTPDSMVTTVGRATFSGTVLLSVVDLASGRTEPVEARGEVQLAVGFGSRQTDMAIRNIRPTAGGSLPFRELVWTGLSLCGGRIGSTGGGGFDLLTEEGVRAREAEVAPPVVVVEEVAGTAAPVPGVDGLPVSAAGSLDLTIGIPLEVVETTWGEGWGSAMFLGRFYGLTAAGQPQSAGGGFLIEGDSGLVSGIFVLSQGK